MGCRCFCERVLKVKFPVSCTTQAEELELVRELKEKLRLWHNVETKDMSPQEAEHWFNTKFRNKSMAVEALINERSLLVLDGVTGGLTKYKPLLQLGKWDPSLSLLDSVGDRVQDIIDPKENYTTGILKDDNTRFTVGANLIQVAGLLRNEDAWLYWNKGAGRFSGDVEHWVDIYQGSASQTNGYFMPWVLANIVGSLQDFFTGNEDALLVSAIPQKAPNNARIFLWEVDGGVAYTDSYPTGSLDTWYYLKIIRDEEVGTYGTEYCYIYSNAIRSVLVDTLSITLHTSKKDFDLVYGAQSYNTGNTNSFTGQAANLDLKEAAGFSFMALMKLKAQRQGRS